MPPKLKKQEILRRERLSLRIRIAMLRKGIRPMDLQKKFRRDRITVWVAFAGRMPTLMNKIAKYVESK